MTSASAVRGRGRWSRPLALAALVVLGTACGGGGDSGTAAVHHGTSADRSPAAPAPSGQQPVNPAPLGTGPGRDPAAALVATPKAAVPPPPPPDLGTQRPQAPTNTVSLESLHQQGRTNVVR